MCFQGFIYYSCGHNGLEESECDDARLLDLPFFIKIHCPQYHTKRCRTDRSCGTGGYYCKQTRDGPFLEKVHDSHTRAKQELTRYDTRLAKLQIKEAEFDKSANASNVSMEARRLHPAYHKLSSTHQQLLTDRNKCNALMARTAKIIGHAIEWYRLREPAAADAVGVTFEEHARKMTMLDPSQGGLNFAPAAHGLDQGFQYVPRSSAITANAIDVSAGYLHPSRQNFYPGNNLLPGAGSDMSMTPRNRTDFGYRLNVSSMTDELPTSNAPKKRGRPYKRTIKQTTASPEKRAIEREESPAVRRSTRVRGKKVSYAESIGSGGESRETSPFKSDDSGFSPPKSESASPDKSDVSGRPRSRGALKEVNELDVNKIRRSGTSLGNLIGDWQRRSGAVGQFGQRNNQTPRESSYGEAMKRKDSVQPLMSNTAGSAINPSLSQLLTEARSTKANSAPAISTGHNGRPPTRRGPPNQHPFGPPGNMGNPQPAATPNFFPNANMPVGVPNLFNIYANGGMYSGATAAPNLSSPYQQRQALNMPPSLPNANRNWLINTPAFNTQAYQPAPPDHSPEIREVIIAHDTQNEQAALNAPATMVPHTPGNSMQSEFTADFAALPASLPYTPADPVQGNTYDRMHRSFSGSVPDLHATASTIDFTTPASIDPPKRKISASSPAIASNKRVRLSLPGEDSTSSIYEHNTLPYDEAGSASSPSKMPSQQHQQPNENDAARDSIENIQPTPAPKLVPTAVMYIPSDEEQAEIAPEVQAQPPALQDDIKALQPLEDNEAGELPQQAAVVDEGVDAFGNPFSSDIDWGFLNDDAFGEEN